MHEVLVEDFHISAVLGLDLRSDPSTSGCVWEITLPSSDARSPERSVRSLLVPLQKNELDL